MERKSNWETEEGMEGEGGGREGGGREGERRGEMEREGQRKIEGWETERERQSR